jgi:3-oxoacyl-[acyl-carrier protein] reductase
MEGNGQMSTLEGKKAVVTGAGIGIGQEIALDLARQGADVAVTYFSHDGEVVADTVRSIGRKASAYHLDVTDSGEVGRVLDEAARSLGGHIDILVNNAGGLVGRQDLGGMSDEHWHQVIDLNLSSAFYCSRAALATMPDGGRIVNISSQAARNGGGTGAGAYAAAKAGMIGFTRGLAKEVANRRITVNAITPGLILDTPFHERFTPLDSQAASIASTPLARAGYPSDVAGAVTYLVSEAASFLTGVVIDVNGGTYFA